MTTNFLYGISITMLLGLFTMSSFDYSDNTTKYNNTISFSDLDQTVERDSTPQRSRSKSTYRKNKDGQRIYLSIEDGVVKKLKINGRKIPKSEYGEYADLIEELQGGIGITSPTPPTPPTVIASASSTPTPPTPPSAPLMDEIEEAHEAIAEAHREIERAHKQIENSHSKTSEEMATALFEDGIIDDPQNYRFSLSKKKLKVNGKKQSSAVHEKYLNLYEELTGKTMNGKSVYSVHHNNN